MRLRVVSGLIALAAIILLSFPLNSNAQEAEPAEKGGLRGWWDDAFVRWGGVSQFHFAYDLENDNSREDLGEARLKLSTYLDINPWPKSRLHVSVLGMSTMAGRWPDITVKPEWVQRTPYEAYIIQSLWKFDITAGYQTAKWGANEFLSPTDNLNPLDLRGFVDPDREDVAIPIPMIKAILFITDFIFIEGVAIPFFQPGLFHEFGTDFALCKEDICPIEPDEEVEFTGPSPWETSWEYGGRIRAQVSDFIFEASYLFTREDLPVYKSIRNNRVIGFTDAIITSRYPEYEVIGGGIAWRYKKMALRVEGSYSPEREFSTLPEDENSDSYSYVNARGRVRPEIHPMESEYYTWAVEAEYNPSRRLYFLVAYSEFVVLNPPNYMDAELSDLDRGIKGKVRINKPSNFLLISNKYTNVMLLMMRATALRERLTFKLGAIVFLQDKRVRVARDLEKWVFVKRIIEDIPHYEYILAPRIAYQATNHVELSVGANILQGKRADTQGLGGIAPVSMYTENDNAFVGLRYSF